jgi:Double zinc ribbon
MTTVPAIFGLDSGTLNTIVELAVLGSIVLWLALVWYTFSDARRRVEDGMLVGSATIAAILFPLLGTVVYVIVRPPEFLEDVRERDLEMAAAQARMASQEFQLCPHCEAPTGRDFLRCPLCLNRLRDTCGNCAKPLDADWLVCPYCDADIPGVTPPRRRAIADDEGETDVALVVEEHQLPPTV